MIDCRFAPLERWPRKKTLSQEYGRYKATYGNTLDLLEKELNHLRAKNIVIEIDVSREMIRNDGWPRSNATPKYSGVIVSFDSKYGPLSLPCDHFRKWEHNLRAIAHHLEHLRLSDLYGVSVSGEQYKGWTALPAAGESMTLRKAAQCFYDHSGFGTVETIISSASACRVAYRNALHKTHPDKGGSREFFDEVQAAWKVLKQHHSLT